MKKKTAILSIFLAAFMVLALNVSNAKAAATGQDIVNYANKFQGTPYKWGGTTTSGFDCSGFVQYVYKNAAGINLPTTTGEQINVGTPDIARVFAWVDSDPGASWSFALDPPNSNCTKLFKNSSKVVTQRNGGYTCCKGSTYKITVKGYNSSGQVVAENHIFLKIPLS